MPIVGAIFGATSSGKTDIAFKLAQKNNLEIISADSRQVYQDMAIGTGLADTEMLKAVPHHLVQYVSPSQTFGVKNYCDDVYKILKERPDTSFLLVGGTPLYIRTLLFGQAEGGGAVPPEIRKKVQLSINSNGKDWAYAELSKLDPAAAQKVHPNDMYRVTKRLENFYYTKRSYTENQGMDTLQEPFKNTFLINLLENRAVLHRKINSRVKKMFEEGWVEEVEKLAKTYNNYDLPAFSALGYGEISMVLKAGKRSQNWSGEIRTIQSKTKTYAKRQINYFSTRIKGSKAIMAKELYTGFEKAQWELKKCEKFVSKLLTE